MRRAISVVAVGLLLLVGAASAQAEPAWLPARDVAPGGVPQAAVDQAGNAVVVWSTSNGTDLVARAATRTAGGGFSAPVDLSAKGQSAVGAQVAMDGAGNAIAIWRRGKVVQAAFRPAGGSFSAAVDVSVQGHQTTDHQLSINAAGDATVVWRQSDDAFISSIRAATRVPGGGFSPPARASADGVNSQSPQVAVDAAGGSVVVSTRYVGASRVLQASVRPPGGSFAAPTDVTVAAGNADQATVAAGPAGQAIAVFRQLHGTKHVVDVAYQQGDRVTAVASLSAMDIEAHAPQVAVNAAGDAVVAWAGLRGQSDEIQAVTRTAGGSFSAPVPVSGINSSGTGIPGGPSLAPQVAINPAGDALIAWARHQSPREPANQAATRRAGGSFSAPVDLTADGEYALSDVKVKLDSAADAVATWTGLTSAGSPLVRVALYDATPPVLSGASVPATGTVGVPVSFSVSPFDAWSSVSATWSFGDDATAAGAETSHVYTAPGTYEVAVTAADATGTPAVPATGRIEIAPAAAVGPTISGGQGTGEPGTTGGQGTSGPGTSGGSTSALGPKITRLRLAPAAFRAAAGTSVSYRLSTAATLSFTVERRARGRFVPLRGSVTHRSKAGDNRFRFSGRLRGRRLAPGRYRLVATPAAGAARGRGLRASFRVLSR